MQNLQENFQHVIDRCRAAMLDYLDNYNRFSLVKKIEETVTETLIPFQFKDKDTENAKSREESFIIHAMELYYLGYHSGLINCDIT